MHLQGFESPFINRARVEEPPSVGTAGDYDIWNGRDVFRTPMQVGEATQIFLARWGLDDEGRNTPPLDISPRTSPSPAPQPVIEAVATTTLLPARQLPKPASDAQKITLERDVSFGEIRAVCEKHDYKFTLRNTLAVIQAITRAGQNTDSGTRHSMREVVCRIVEQLIAHQGAQLDLIKLEEASELVVGITKIIPLEQAAKDLLKRLVLPISAGLLFAVMTDVQHKHAKCLSYIAYAYSKIQWTNPAAKSSVEGLLTSTLTRFSEISDQIRVQEASNLLLAIVKIGLRNPTTERFVNTVSGGLVSLHQERFFTTQGICAILWSLATLDKLEPAVLNKLLSYDIDLGDLNRSAELKAELLLVRMMYRDRPGFEDVYWPEQIAGYLDSAGRSVSKWCREPLLTTAGLKQFVNTKPRPAPRKMYTRRADDAASEGSARLRRSIEKLRDLENRTPEETVSLLVSEQGSHMLQELQAITGPYDEGSAPPPTTETAVAKTKPQKQKAKPSISKSERAKQKKLLAKARRLQTRQGHQDVTQLMVPQEGSFESFTPAFTPDDLVTSMGVLRAMADGKLPDQAESGYRTLRRSADSLGALEELNEAEAHIGGPGYVHLIGQLLRSFGHALSVLLTATLGIPGWRADR